MEVTICDLHSEVPTSQFVILDGKGQNIKDLPYAFTEHGVVMLASLLRSEIAVKMSVQITRAFVAIKMINNESF